MEDDENEENDIRQLKARRHDLANKLAQQQKRRDKIQVIRHHRKNLAISIFKLTQEFLYDYVCMLCHFGEEE